MSETFDAAWPERLKQAMLAKQQLAEQQLFFAPIRHHSPACAYALKHYIEQLQPTHILIEGPDSFEFLLPSLVHTETVPPVAIFAQAQAPQKASESEDEAVRLASAYFPFCQYSPEWIALQQGNSLGAKLQFIDLSWAKQSALDQSQRLDVSQRSLMSERYLAHSQYIQRLAQASHCRNHDELWDHLFELQTPTQLAQAETFFNEVFSWCALARLDYEPEVLLQDGSLHREDCMWQHIAACLKPEHKVLVVTGGFHTLALIELISQQLKQQADCKKNPETAKKPNAKATQRDQLKATPNNWQEHAWLIRYSFDRLDALNGYASGMPSPAYYQQLWQDLTRLSDEPEQSSVASPKPATASLEHSILSYISGLCHHLDQAQCLDINSFLAIKQTTEIAWQLAELRGHYRPSRYDLLDALQTSLVKGELEDGQQQLFQQIYQYLGGQALGRVPPDQHHPALVDNVYRQIEKFRFNLSDTLKRQRKLDVYRKPLHQQISQFLHLLDYLDCGFAQRLSGPDYVLGAGLDLLFEEWRYAWTPSVEARLLELAEQGDQLEKIAIRKLLQQQSHNQQQGLGQSAVETAKLLALACRLGLKQQLELFSLELQQYLYSDQNLGSIIQTAQQLYYLWHGRQLLQLPEQQLQHSLILALQQACYLLDQLYDSHEEKIEENLKHLKHLHELILNVQQQIGAKLDDEQLKQSATHLLDLMYQQIDLEQLRQNHLSKLKGAVDVLRFIDQRIAQQQLTDELQLSFATGSDAEEAVQYLQGMLHIAPEIFVQSHIAIDALYQLVNQWSDELFIQILPDLRFAFSLFNPKQTRQIAERIAELSGLSQEVVLDQVFSHLSEQQVLEGVALNQQLQQLLSQDQLLDWLYQDRIDTQLQQESQHDA